MKSCNSLKRFLYKGFSHCQFPHKILQQSEEVVKTTENVYDITDTYSLLYINWNYMTLSDFH